MNAQKTALTLEALTSIHAEAKRIIEAGNVFPVANFARAREVFRERGRGWAETVLLRSLPSPRFLRHVPGMNDEECLILIMADRAEWELRARTGEEAQP